MSKQKYVEKFGEPRASKGEAAPNLRLEAGNGTVDVFTVNLDACVGCNMCALACPVDGCITMQKVETGKPPMSWNQYQAQLAAGKMEAIAPKKAAKQ